MTRNQKIIYAIGVGIVVVLILLLIFVEPAHERKNPSPTASASTPSGSTATAFLDVTPTPVPSPTASPVPTTKPSPKPNGSTSNLDKKGKEWAYGYYTREYDENGVPQLVYELESWALAITDKYEVITGHQDKKQVYFTFDEGYENGYTPIFLDVLKEKGVQGVFFLTGDFIESEPELVKRMYNEGHILGNHTENHPLMADLSDEKFRQELEKVDQRVDELLGFDYQMRYYRPPQGYFSERDMALANNMGYIPVFWSFAYDDYSKPNESSDEQVRKSYLQVTQSAHDGEVLLLHAISKVNSQILGDVIDWYRANGYTIASLDSY